LVASHLDNFISIFSVVFPCFLVQYFISFSLKGSSGFTKLEWKGELILQQKSSWKQGGNKGHGLAVSGWNEGCCALVCQED